MASSLSLLVLWIVCCSRFVFGAEWRENENQIQTARCMSTCLSLVKAGDTCKNSTSCTSCWHTCDFYLKVSNSDKTCGFLFCDFGCRTACKFINKIAGKPEPTSSPKPTHSKIIFQSSEEGSKVSWKLVPEPDLPFVSLIGTLDLRGRYEWLPVMAHPSVVTETLPAGVSLRLLAVTPRGIAADRWFQRSELAPPLDIRAVALTRSPRRLGVQALVRWRPHVPGRRYEVAWRALDDVVEITGHLHSRSDNATITLWPLGLYAITVTCLKPDGSSCGVSNTHVVNAQPPLPETTAEEERKLPLSSGDSPIVTHLDKKCVPLEVGLGVLSCLLVVLLVICCCTLVRSCQRSKVKCSTLPTSQSLKFYTKTPIVSPVLSLDDSSRSSSGYFVFDIPKSKSASQV